MLRLIFGFLLSLVVVGIGVIYNYWPEGYTVIPNPGVYDVPVWRIGSMATFGMMILIIGLRYRGKE